MKYEYAVLDNSLYPADIADLLLKEKGPFSFKAEVVCVPGEGEIASCISALLKKTSGSSFFNNFPAGKIEELTAKFLSNSSRREDPFKILLAVSDSPHLFISYNI